MTDDPIYIKTSISIDYKQLEILANHSYELSILRVEQSYLTDVDRIKCLKDADHAITTSLQVKDLLREIVLPDDGAKRTFDKNNNPFLVQKIKICLELENFREALESLERSKARVLAEQINERNQEKYKPITFEQIQTLVNDFTAILEWFIFDKDCFGVFIILPKEDRPKLMPYSEKNLRMLESWANTYRNTYYNQRSEWQDKLEQRIANLSSILQLQTIIRDYLPNSITNLILIPHRYLHLFPLHVLPVGNQLLCEKYTVSYAPSSQLLQEAKKRNRQKFDHLFAIQNPTGDLNYTNLEVQTIQQYFQTQNILIETQAKKTAIDDNLLSIAHCAHFSCHGYFNFENPLLSALLLADCEIPPPSPNPDPNHYLLLQNNNTLDLKQCFTLADIFKLNLKECRLVVLSACETGLTDFSSFSDEYIGLPSGFLVAGSPSVLCSLWSVNDLSTAFLLIQFYENLKSGSTVAVALNKAQTWLRDAKKEELQAWATKLPLNAAQRVQLMLFFRNIKDNTQPFESPYYWAAFCAIGE